MKCPICQQELIEIIFSDEIIKYMCRNRIQIGDLNISHYNYDIEDNFISIKIIPYNINIFSNKTDIYDISFNNGIYYTTKLLFTINESLKIESSDKMLKRIEILKNFL